MSKDYCSTTALFTNITQESSNYLNCVEYDAKLDKKDCAENLYLIFTYSATR